MFKYYLILTRTSRIGQFLPFVLLAMLPKKLRMITFLRWEHRKYMSRRSWQRSTANSTHLITRKEKYWHCDKYWITILNIDSDVTYDYFGNICLDDCGQHSSEYFQVASLTEFVKKGRSNVSLYFVFHKVSTMLQFV